jgi:hypothetical protein
MDVRKPESRVVVVSKRSILAMGFFMLALFVTIVYLLVIRPDLTQEWRHSHLQVQMYMS